MQNQYRGEVMQDQMRTDLTSVAESALRILKDKGADKAQVSLYQEEAQELQVENNRMSLLRSTFDQGITFKVIRNQMQAVKASNQLTPSSLEDLAATTLEQSQSGAPDEAYDIAPSQDRRSFHSGLRERDDAWAFQKLNEFLSEAREMFPEVILTATLKYVKTKKVLLNSQTCHFESDQGYYELGTFFSSQKGKMSSSFNFTNAIFGKISESLMQKNDMQELLRQSVEQLQVQKIPAKFEGEILITPFGLGSFLGEILSYLGTDSLVKGTSIYKDKMDQRIASDAVTLRSLPIDDRFIAKSFWTGDGFLTQNSSLIEKGVLKSFLLDQYGANKLKQARAPHSGSHLVVSPGDKSLSEMVAGIKRGLLVYRMSSGKPAENGDFSGVVKNSYYIEDGRIQYPVSEVMVSGNLAQLLLNVTEVSKESIDFGSSIFPWVRAGGVTVS